MKWKELEWDASMAAKGKVDAGLLWGSATDFRLFRRASLGEHAPRLYAVLLQFKTARSLDDFAGEVEDQGGQAAPSSLTVESHFHTAAVTLTHLQALVESDEVERIELQMPVIPGRPAAGDAGPAVPPGALPRQSLKAVPSPHPEVFLGVIDSGCPFAHPDYRRTGARGAAGTRVANLWLQQAATQPGRRGHGQVLERATLEHWMRLSQPPGSPVVDEAACYRRLGPHDLRSRMNHGAAVLSLLAGRQQPLAADPPAAPSPSTSPAEHSDLAFVQLPQDAVQDSSSAGLARCLLDGLRHIVHVAPPQARRIVVNISDGSSRGSHDGQSLFELALKELLDSEPRLRVVVAAGNSFLEERHARIALRPGRPREIKLRLMPGSEAPSFVFIRIPAGAARVSIQVTAPDGRTVGAPVGAGTAQGLYAGAHPVCAVIHPPSLGHHATMAWVAWYPTRCVDVANHAPPAPAGDWTLSLSTTEPLAEPVHLYVARNQTNPGALPRGQQARFIDPRGPDHDQRHLNEWEDDPDPEVPPPNSSFIHRHGSLNSLAAFVHRGLRVAGAALQRERAPSLYSAQDAAGPAPRMAWAPADAHRALPGIRAHGGVGGTVVRVSGTSFAAPQVARALANGQALHKRIGKRRRTRLSGA